VTRVLVLFLLLLAGCPAAAVTPACSDKAYAALVAKCAAAAVACRQQGGTETECGAVCDQKADDWQKACGQ
jgi:hypothetical protein